MLIIEGSDLVGKTTLCKALCAKLNELGWPHVYRHCGQPPDCWRLEPFSCYARLMSPYLVQDRFDLSEIVYAPLRNANPHMSPAVHSSIGRHLRSHCSYLVVVTADEELLRRRYVEANRSEMFTLGKILEANDRFIEAAKTGKLDSYRTSVDLHIHCSPSAGGDFFPLQSHIGLFQYTQRLKEMFAYPNARTA